MNDGERADEWVEGGEETVNPSTPRLLITGSRDWTDRGVIRDALAAWFNEFGRNPESVLISGACPTGADAIAESLWAQNGLPLERHRADWAKHGRMAGPIRNREMVHSHPDAVIAFIKNGSRGATGCVKEAKKLGLPVTVYTE